MQVRPILSKGVYAFLDSVFPQQQVWYIGTNDGCSCGFQIDKNNLECDWPEEIIATNEDDFAVDESRISALFCLFKDLITLNDEGISVLAVWEGKNPLPQIFIEHKLNDFFNQKKVFFEERHLYRFT